MTERRIVGEEVYRQRVALLFSKAPVALAAVVVNAALLGWFFDGVVLRATVAQWIVVIGVVTVIRAAIQLAYQRSPEQTSPALWENVHTLGSLLNGLAWAFAGSWFIGAQLSGDVAVVFVVGGLVAGASSSSATSMKSYAAFSAPALVTVIAQLLMAGERIHIVMAVMLLLFGAAMSMLARQNGRVLETSFRLRFEHDDMTLELSRRSPERAVRLQMLLDHSGVAFVVAEPSTGKIVDASKSAEVLFELDHDALTSVRVYDLGLTGFINTEDEWTAFVAKSAAGISTAEYGGRSSEGHRTLEVTSTQQLIHGAEFVLIIIKDVTDRKELEAQLTRSSLLASLGTMSAGVAHEVNNPLSFVLSNLEYIQEELDSRRDDDKSELMESIGDAIIGVQRIRVIVRDLLKTARSSEHDVETVDVKAIIATCLKLADTELRHRAEVDVEFESDKTLARGDTSRLTQVFLNLLLNAARSIPDGQAKKNRVGVVVRRSDDDLFLVVEISDTGRGIAPANLPRIFEPFFTTRPPGEGTGLGLSMCYAIVSDLGGSISVESTLGEGSCFSVRLPATNLAKVIADEAMARTAVVGARVLIVDDDPKVARGTSLQLPDCDVQIETDGEQALRAIERTGAFDVIICDVMMPKMDGVAFYEAVKSVAPHLTSRFIFLTGGVLTDRTREFTASVDSVTLSKPIDTERLRREIHAVVTRHGIVERQ